MWDAGSGTMNHRLVGHLAPVLCTAFSPDGRTLATGGRDGVIKVWHVATGQELAELDQGDDECRKLQFTSDGKHLAALIGYTQVLIVHAD